MEERLKKQLKFLIEIDQMKTVLRRNLIADGSRQENDAEHSWHMALMAATLSEYANGQVDLSRVLQMCLLHDLVEVYAGDTFCYDQAGYADKEKREKDAADLIFGMLPQEQGNAYRSLWEEFDRMDTPDSAFAAAVDRVQPFLLNYCTDGHTWTLGEIDSSMVYERMAPVRHALPALWPVLCSMVEDCIARGLLPRGENETVWLGAV